MRLDVVNYQLMVHFRLTAEENLDHQPSFWEGDIILTDGQKKFYNRMSNALTFKKALVKDVRKLWSKTTEFSFGTVPPKYHLWSWNFFIYQGPSNFDS